MNDKRLVYVMDPMCSWCWGFAPVADALADMAAERGIAMHIVVGGLRRELVPVTEADRTRYLGYWESVHATTGQAFNLEQGLPTGMVFDTEPACRALVTARLLDDSKVRPLLRQLQTAFYLQGIDITQAAALVNQAEQAGLSRTRFAELFDEPSTREQTEADFAWVQRLGIAGFPTLLVESNGQLALLTNGYQPLEALSPLLQRWLEHVADA